MPVERLSHLLNGRLAAELPECGGAGERQRAADDGDGEQFDHANREEAATSHESRYNRRKFNVCDRRLKAS